MGLYRVQGLGHAHQSYRLADKPLYRSLAGEIEKARDSPMSERKKCSCEVWARTVGFMRTTQDFNPGKLEEYSERAKFDKSLQDEEPYPEIEKDGFK